MEIWKDIPNYEGLYQVSNIGRIKRLEGFVNAKFGLRRCRERILKFNYDKNGYCMVSLSKNSVQKKVKVHHLVYSCFVGDIAKERNLVLDHIDNNPKNNTVSNLQIITHRKNCLKDKNSKGGYRNISYSNYNKWLVVIRINTKKSFIGSFEDIGDAIKARDLAIKNICFFKNPKQYRALIRKLL